MKKKYIWIILGTILIIALAIFITIISCKAISSKKDNSEKITVHLFVDGEFHSSFQTTLGKPISVPETREIEGYRFDGWFTSSNYTLKWNFENEAIEDVSLYGIYIPLDKQTVSVSFVVDDVISTKQTEIGGKIENYVPDKLGYEFLYWKNGDTVFNFESPLFSDVTLNAYWKPITYTIKFQTGQNKYTVRTFTIENLIVDEPPVPEIKHYVGSWEEYSLSLCDKEVHAVYKPKIYEINYYIDGTKYKVNEYKITDSSYSHPDVPYKFGYSGAWSEYTTVNDEIEITAIYTPKNITITYSVDDTLYREYNCYVFDEIEEPAIPQKVGYTSRWNKTAETEDRKEFSAIYTPIEYKATFKADGNICSEIPFTVETVSLSPPDVPDKSGYFAVWEDYEISANDIEINAVYTIINYKAEFIDDGVKVDEQIFNVENMSVTTPSLTFKEGFAVKWQDFTLQLADIKISTVYTPVDVSLFTLNLSSSGFYTLTGYTGSESEIVLPQIYKGKLVKKIKEETFLLNTTLEKIEIPYGYEEIAATAFGGCNNLRSVLLPNSLKTIRQGAFALCDNLKKIILPEGLETLEVEAFGESGLESIYIPGTLKTIINRTFSNCSKLKYITIGNGVEMIEAGAFENISTAKEVIFENPEGWYYCESMDDEPTALDKSVMSDKLSAAQMLMQIPDKIIYNQSYLD